MLLVEKDRKAFGEILREKGLVTQSQIEEALAIQRETSGALGAVLIELGYITEQDRLETLGEQAGMKPVQLRSTEIPPEVINKVSLSIANVYRIVPFKEEDGVLHVAMADPLNVNALDDLRFMLNCEVAGAVSTEEDVLECIEKYYAGQSESVEKLIDELESARADSEDVFEVGEDSSSITMESLQELANSMPVVKLLNLILLQAIKDQSSDIHFEPYEEEFRVRYRVDGVLYEMMPPPKHLAVAIVSRIKVMSLLDISETRLPQDGRIELNISGNPIDLRVSTLPTMFGESVVMRVLDRSVVALDIDRIGMRDDEVETIRDLIKMPHGIILVTGPTGSGKTTTLYAALNAANDVGVKIITTEDPVEYDLAGVVQVQINEEIGTTFARCLRSILRQDPDIILVGEIRDLETAEISIQASLTGHLVLSTLHTNDAPSTVTRLVDMGVEAFLMTATVEAIVAQRLVRTICLECKQPYTPNAEVLMEVDLTPEEVQGREFHYGTGCESCNNTGYRGRTALFEIMKMTDDIREMIMEQASTQALREVAKEQGMRLLRDSGILKIFDGVSTIEEVVKETLAL